MKPRTRQRRKPPIGSPEGIAAYVREQERFRRGLLRRVQAWARTWERCPLAGCRRNSRCLKEDACRGVSQEPLTEEDLLRIRTALQTMKNAGPAPAAVAVDHDA